MTASDVTRSLKISRHVRAPLIRVFDAWTDPASIVQWWGPPEVRCTLAEVDLRVGGSFSIANELPDGSSVRITGVYEAVDAPNRLVHSWSIDDGGEPHHERVEIEFAARDGGTDIAITHTGLPTPEVRAGHEAGWNGCLAGLRVHVEQQAGADSGGL